MATLPYERPQARVQGILDAVRDLATSAWAHLGTRIDVLVLELTEERARLVQGITAGAFAVAGTTLAAGFAGVAVLVWLWDTPGREIAATALPVVFAVGALIARRRARSMLGRESSLFRTSLAEFRHDLEALQFRRDLEALRPHRDPP